MKGESFERKVASTSKSVQAHSIGHRPTCIFYREIIFYFTDRCSDRVSQCITSLILSLIGGFAVLPFLWAVNAIWFAKEAFVMPSYPEQRRIRQCVIRSAIGACIWIAGLTAWIVMFQINRSEWGATADKISFIIPKGIP